MIVALDIDGVLVDFQGGWSELYKTHFNRDAVFLDQWDALVQGTHFEAEAEFWKWVGDCPHFWANLKPIPGALGGVYDLLKAGHRLVLVTHRPAEARYQTLAWLDRHWPGPIPTLHHVPGDKSVVPAQIYVDDAPKVLAQLAHLPAVIRFRQPWNQPVKGTVTAQDWKDLVRMIGVMARGGAVDPEDEAGESQVAEGPRVPADAGPDSPASDPEDKVMQAAKAERKAEVTAP